LRGGGFAHADAAGKTENFHGAMEQWSVGVLEYWGDGLRCRAQQSNTPILQYSIFCYGNSRTAR
jgi:hypothetical protein